MCFAFACEVCLSQSLGHCDLAKEFEPFCVKLVWEGYEKKRCRLCVRIYGAIEELGLWLARYQFRAVHYAGSEAIEEEWHDSLVMRDFMNTEEEEEEEENATIRSGRPGSVGAERRPGEQGAKMDLISQWSSDMVQNSSEMLCQWRR